MNPTTQLPTAEDAYDGRTVPTAPVAGLAALLHWHHPEAPWIPADTAVDAATSIAVYVNHGRWIAECPVCHGAQFASRTDKRFFCADCLNAYNGGKWVAVVWPPAATMRAIERTLLRRHRGNQHWYPGETHADLMAENEANAHLLVAPPPGVPTPPDAAPPDKPPSAVTPTQPGPPASMP